MQRKVFSKSLKKMKKHEVFDYGMDKIIQMQKQMQRQENLIKPRQKPIKSMIEIRKQMIEHKFSKNNIQKEVDKVIESLLNQKRLLLSNEKINKKNSYKHYRIETQPVQDLNKILNADRSRLNSQKKQKTTKNPSNILPEISKSKSQKSFSDKISRKLKTEQNILEKSMIDSRNKIIQYINIDNVIKHYRVGMTSLVKQVYQNPYNPYKKNYK